MTDQGENVSLCTHLNYFSSFLLLGGSWQFICSIGQTFNFIIIIFVDLYFRLNMVKTLIARLVNSFFPVVLNTFSFKKLIGNSKNASHIPPPINY
jgi:hypothetical protein